MADVHLDTPFQNKNARIRALLRDAGRQAFENGVKLALARKVDAILIAGDFFDNDTLSFATEKFLLEQLIRLKEANIPVFYAPGNHDPYGASYRLNHIVWPDNVHIFAARVPTTLPVIDQEGRTKAFITGAGHEGTREAENLAQSFPPARSGAPHIGLLHTLVSGARGETEHDRYAPCVLDDLRDKGYTYWALGHIHTRSQLFEEPLIIYPGNLVGRNPREDGSRGAYLVEIDDQGKARAVFQPLAPVCWATFRVANLLEADNLESLERLILASVDAQLENSHYPAGFSSELFWKAPAPCIENCRTKKTLLL